MHDSTDVEILNLGPNYIWHMDGYDKLKPFGIAVHGCIDGYCTYIYFNIVH